MPILLDANIDMNCIFFRKLDYTFLDISALEGVFINLALYKCFILSSTTTTTYVKIWFKTISYLIYTIQLQAKIMSLGYGKL